MFLGVWGKQKAVPCKSQFPASLNCLQVSAPCVVDILWLP